MTNQCNCTECDHEVKGCEGFCSFCGSPIPYNLVNRDLVEFMTEEVKPTMAPRSDHG